MYKGESTLFTYLYVGVQSANTLVHIKSYPDLMGSPDTIEITDCDDESQKFTAGVKTNDSIEFTANFLQANFDELNTMIETAGDDDLHFKLFFGTTGDCGTFEWEGRMAVRISGGDVNSAREMVVVCYPSTEIEDTTTIAEPEFYIYPTSMTMSLSDEPVMVNIVSNFYTGARWINLYDNIVSVESLGDGRMAIITPVGVGEASVQAVNTQDPYDPDYFFNPQCVVTVEE